MVVQGRAVQEWEVPDLARPAQGLLDIVLDALEHARTGSTGPGTPRPGWQTTRDSWPTPERPRATIDGFRITGGGIFADSSNVSILDNVIRGNTAGRGAASPSPAASVRILGNTVQENVGVADHGGGLYTAATGRADRGG